VATRLVAGKLLNAGQSCIAPDYLLVPVGSEDRLLAALRGAVGKLYPRLADNPDYSSIVSDRHFQRLASLLADAHDKGARVFEINPASETFPAKTRRMPLQVLFDVTDEMTVMQEEIFGPLLPVVTVASLDQAIRYVNCRPRPLALYWFGSEIANRDRVLAETISGGVTINDTLLHIAQENLPFGGVGASGQGVYHGEHGFLTFSQEKPVYFQTTVNGASLLYPPYGRRVERILAWLKKLA
jgi:coniferyl-aldehyde dehydrogenase